MVSRIMSMGVHDEAGHERRGWMTSQVEPGTDDNQKTYYGSVEYDSGGSTDALLEQLKRMKSDD